MPRRHEPRTAAIRAARGLIAACRLAQGRIEEAETALAIVRPDERTDAFDGSVLLDLRAQLRLAQLRPADALSGRARGGPPRPRGVEPDGAGRRRLALDRGPGATGAWREPAGARARRGGARAGARARAHARGHPRPARPCVRRERNTPPRSARGSGAGRPGGSAAARVHQRAGRSGRRDAPRQPAHGRPPPAPQGAGAGRA